ncbi:MAG: TIGR02147 family protein [Oligoflexus sp.]
MTTISKTRKLVLLHACSKLSIFDYLSFKDYLKELYKILKEEHESYSYKKFSEDLGLSVSNVIWLYISGKRHMTPKTGDKIFKQLQLKHEAKRYAELLVKLETIVIHAKREQIFQDLFEIKTRAAKDESKQQLEFYSEWYFPVIKEMIAMLPASDPQSLAEKCLFKVFPKQIEQSLKVLEGLDLIQFDPAEKCYRITSKQIGLDYETSKIATARFHQKVCELASEAVVQVPDEMRELNTLTLSLAEKDLPKIREIILECCQKIFAMEGQETKPDRVFQLNVQFFPVTRKLTRDGAS